MSDNQESRQRLIEQLQVRIAANRAALMRRIQLETLRQQTAKENRE